MFCELIIILYITYAGSILKELLHIPLPGTIVAMMLMFILLYKKYLKLDTIGKTTDFLLTNMTILFLPSMIEMYEYFPMLKKDLFKILFLMIITTILTIVVTSKVVNMLIEKRRR